jgi:hypothetical protein
MNFMSIIKFQVRVLEALKGLCNIISVKIRVGGHEVWVSG